MVPLFFSYSHRDEEARNELEVHLAMLKRQGVLSIWHDRRIGAGKDIHSEISVHLDATRIILFLVSPHFLASDYCYEVEMGRALERHKAGDARVIPIILHPCDWKHSPLRDLRATPLDGKPISQFTNLHEAYLAVTADIRTAAEELTGAIQEPPLPLGQCAPAVVGAGDMSVRSGNLRMKREFTDHERDDFLEHAFEYVARFFENSLLELKDRNPGIDTRFRRIDLRHITAAVYVKGERRAACRIWLAADAALAGGILFSHSDTGGDSGFNEALNIKGDGYALVFNPLGMAFYGQIPKPGEGLTEHGAADYLWSIFIRPLQ